MTKHRKDRVRAQIRHEIEDDEAQEMERAAREEQKARLGVPGRGGQGITGGRPAPQTGEVKRR